MNSGATEEKAAGYRDRLVWQKGIALVKLVYSLTREFPGEEKFGLVSQMRRAAVSIPSNIAQGQARHTSREFVQFLSHAERSIAELDTQLTIAVELKFAQRSDAEEILALTDELRRMMNSLRRNVAARAAS